MRSAAVMQRRKGAWDVNYASPLVRNPCLVVSYLEGAGAPWGKGLKFSGPLTKTASGGADWGVAPSGGVCGSFPSVGTSGDDWVAVPTIADIIPILRVTYAFVRQPIDTTITNTRSFGQRSTGGTTTRAGGHCPFSDGTIYWDFGGASGPNRTTWAGYTPSTKLEKWVFVAGNRGMAIYFNGVQVASQTTPIARAQSVEAVGINTGNATISASPNRVLLFAALDTEWSAAEALEWSQNPMQLVSQVAAAKFYSYAAVASAAGHLLSLRRRAVYAQ